VISLTLGDKSLIGRAKHQARGASRNLAILLKRLIKFDADRGGEGPRDLLQRNNLLDSSLCSAHIGGHRRRRFAASASAAATKRTRFRHDHSDV
jgi:hypothetical protein